MATKGWYPDPDGTPGRFRYWDGNGWSQLTTGDPHRTPAPANPDNTGTKRRTDRGWVVALVALAVVTVIAVVVMVLVTGGLPGVHTSASEDTNSSTPTVSAWDETSSPTTPPPPPTDVGGVWVDCPDTTGQGNTAQVPGRLTSGPLSVAYPSSYATDWWGFFSLAYDFHAVDRPVGGNYVSTIGLGLISHADGFTDLTTTANQVMQCWSTTYHPRDTNPEILIPGEQISVSGHTAWHIEWHIIYLMGEPIPGEILDVIIVDMGPQADYYGMFICCRPVNSPDFDAGINTAMASLTVS